MPIYFAKAPNVPASVTVLHCAFDGQRLTYLKHGDEWSLNIVRGLCEPSIIAFGDRFYLTIRNDIKGYVTVSNDGLHYQPMKPWTFDDGSELGSYNTQQHWLAHHDGLFLAYTRRGADDDPKTMGDRVDEPILELTRDRLLLLDKDGKTEYDWRRVRRP